MNFARKVAETNGVRFGSHSPKAVSLQLIPGKMFG